MMKRIALLLSGLISCVLALAWLPNAAIAAPSAGSPRLERRLAAVLDAASAAALARGDDPGAIVLADGRTLAELLAAEAAGSAPLAFTPIAPCTLVRTAATAAGAFAGNEERSLQARGGLAAQGGSAAGCGIPDDARALALIARVTARARGSFRLWPAGEPEPSIALLDYAAPVTTVPALVELCRGAECPADLEARALGAPAHLRLDVVGYFAPVTLAPGPQGDRGPAGPQGDPGAPGAPGASCTLSTVGGVATLVCPDGSTVSWRVEEPPAAQVRSFQVQTPAIDVPANTAITFCFYFRTPNTETVGIRRWSSAGPAGIHDLTLFTTVDERRPPGTLSSTDCGFAELTAPAGGLPSWVYDAHGPIGELALPADDGAGNPLGLEVTPGTPAALRIHYVNASPNAIHAPVTLSAEALPAGVAYTRTHTLITFNGNISIPPQAIDDVETMTCDVPVGASFWRLSTNTHQQATAAVLRDGAATAFTAASWDQPGAASFAAPSFFAFTTGKITYECTYANPTNRTIQSGDSFSTDEQCMAVTYFFPTTESRFCFNGVLIP